MILSFVGIFWAMIAWIGLLVPFTILESLLNGESLFGSEALLFLGVQSYLGYFMWIGWMFRARDRRYVVKRRVLWGLSFLHHACWLFFFFCLNEAGLRFVNEAPLLFTYIFTVMSVTGVFAFCDTEELQVPVHLQHLDA